MEDLTPIQGNSINGPSQELEGFALYDSASQFLTSLGLTTDEVASLPQIIVGTVGSLLKQVDDSNAEVDSTQDDMRNAVRHLQRIRIQRDALRDALLRMGMDPDHIVNQAVAGMRNSNGNNGRREFTPYGMEQRRQ